jgi:hypothetical protein
VVVHVGLLRAGLAVTRAGESDPDRTPESALLLILIVLALAIVAGFAAHGSLRPFEHLRIHWWGAALMGLGLQVVPLPEDADRLALGSLLAASYALLIGCVWVNRRLPGAPLMLLGLALNLVVVVPNGGMPVSAEAVRIAGGSSDQIPVGGSQKHHLMTDEDVVRPLADVIPAPPPLGDVLSIGDLFLYAGLASFVVLVMLGRSGENRRPPARWLQMYRGKHLGSKGRSGRMATAHHPRLALPVVATRQGIAP